MNIFLVGYRGAGKTEVGRDLADKLELDFVDMDEFISQKSKCTIADIFREEGESKFRELERSVLFEIASEELQVVATGGGVVLLNANVDLMQSRGIVVFLKCDPTIAANRILADPKTKDSRPSLTQKSLRGEVKEISLSRGSNYRNSADFSVDTSRMLPEEISSKIYDLLTIKGGLDLKSRPDFRAKTFDDIIELKPTRMRDNARVLIISTRETYRISPFRFCDSCSTSTSVLAKLEGTLRLRCVECGEWIEPARIGDSPYEYLLPKSWNVQERTRWYRDKKGGSVTEDDSQDALKDFLSVLTDSEQKPSSLTDKVDPNRRQQPVRTKMSQPQPFREERQRPAAKTGSGRRPVMEPELDEEMTQYMSPMENPLDQINHLQQQMNWQSNEPKATGTQFINQQPPQPPNAPQGQNAQPFTPPLPPGYQSQGQSQGYQYPPQQPPPAPRRQAQRPPQPQYPSRDQGTHIYEPSPPRPPEALDNQNQTIYSSQIHQQPPQFNPQQPGQGAGDSWQGNVGEESEIIEMTPANPFDSKSITQPPEKADSPDTAMRKRLDNKMKKKTRLTSGPSNSMEDQAVGFPGDQGNVNDIPALEPVEQPKTPTGKLSKSQKKRTRIVMSMPKDETAEPEPEEKIEPEAPQVRQDFSKKKRAHGQTRIIRKSDLEEPS